MLKPRRLEQGDKIAVVAPSGPVDEERLVTGTAFLRASGFDVAWGNNVLNRAGYLAGTDADRAADLDWAFSDPGIDAVICARGGYGASRLLDMLDYGAIARSGRAFVGFSDITGFHLAIGRHAGLVTFHGPGAEMYPGDPPPAWNTDLLLRALAEPAPLGEIRNPPAAPPVRTIVTGTATGRTAGGNLSLITATLGTRYEIDTSGALLLIEDVGEKPYRIDRMLAHMKMAGKLESIVGVVVGECVGCEPDASRPSFTLDEVIEDYFGRAGRPAISGLAFGHGKYRATIPLGVVATLDASSGCVIIEEGATV